MKNIYKIFSFLLLAGALLLGACEQEEFKGTGKEGLTDFGLQSPESNVAIVLNSGTPAKSIEIKWQASRAGLNSPVLYTWLAALPDGNFDNPLLAIEADGEGLETKLTLTQSQLDEALQSIGIGASQEVTIKWTVEADNGSFVKRATEPFLISVRRFGEGLTAFQLLSPDNGTAILLEEDSPETQVAISWEESVSTLGSDVTYKWIAVLPGEEFSNPILEIPSNSEGNANLLTLSHQQIDDALDLLGYIRGQQVSLDWTVVATTGGFSMQASQKRTITFSRFGSGVPVTFELRDLPANTPDNLEVFLAGEFQNLGVASGNWQEPGSNPSLQLSRNEDGSRSITFMIPLSRINTTISYKYFLATTASPTWSNGEQVISGLSSCGGAPNRSFQFTSNSSESPVVDRVTVWENFCPEGPFMRVSVLVPDNTPEDKDVYVTGNLGFLVWSQPGTDDRTKMNKVGGTDNEYEVWLPVPTDHSGVMKFFLATKTNPTWGYGEQRFNEAETACEGAPDRAFTFDGTNAYSGTVISWEGYCPL
jgi:hypothetical protein